MKTKSKFFIVLFLTLFFSCSQEEIIEPQPIIEANEIPLKKSPTSKFQYSIPTITPCGYGFKVDIQFFGIPSVPTFEYRILDASNQVVDFGFIGDGMNTDWVLNPCQSYTFEYWAFGYGSPAAGDPPTTVITAISDGCGGLFVC